MPLITLDYTVDLFALHELKTEKYPFLLESVATNPKIGRYDLLFYQPQQKIQLNDLSEFDFLEAFDINWKTHQLDEDIDIPKSIPFRGGWFVYFSYELAEQIEPTLSLTRPPYPIAYAAKVGAAIVVDKFKNKTYLVTDLSESSRISELQSDIELMVNSLDVAKAATAQRLNPVSLIEDVPEVFTHGVEKSRQYIIDGDVFQVNLSRQWSIDNQNTPLELYSSLRDNNPAPFASSCKMDDIWVLSSSPERLISITDKKIETRPIAGTRPRSENDNEDKSLSTELIEHFKERAEHVMLIDLERNDLGRVCKAGSVKVDELMIIESYAHVHHIVSNVIGEIRDDITPADAIRAVFPGGTITGAPKVRCMEIIHELEQTYRGAYTGSLGYVNHNGDMDTNILIRTFAYQAEITEFRAGAGIVYDSIAEDELQETRNKAKGLLKAIQIKK